MTSKDLDKDLLKKMFCELALEYEKQIAEVTPQLDAECLALLRTKDFAIELLIAKTHQYDKLVEKIREFITTLTMYNAYQGVDFGLLKELKEMIGYEDDK